MYLCSDLLFEVTSYLTSYHATIFIKWLLHPLWRRGVRRYIATKEATDDTLKNYPQLTHLFCGYNKNFTDQGLASIPLLTYLDCSSNINFTDRGLASVPLLTTLHCGWIAKLSSALRNNRNFTNRGLASLPKLTTLRCDGITRFSIESILRIHNRRT
jgi:hypothetical protein